MAPHIPHTKCFVKFGVAAAVDIKIKSVMGDAMKGDLQRLFPCPNLLDHPRQFLQGIFFTLVCDLAAGLFR